jgi:hypothetical protein
MHSVRAVWLLYSVYALHTAWSPPHFTLYKYISLYLFTQGNSEKVGALVHKRGRKYLHDWRNLQPINSIKGIDRPFGGRVKSRHIWSLLINWRLGNFFSSHFKWSSSQDQQKTNRRRWIIYKVTLTGQSHFLQIFLFCKVTLRNYNNSVQWMYAIGLKNPLV